jgi:hypothetical protein
MHAQARVRFGSVEQRAKSTSHVEFFVLICKESSASASGPESKWGEGPKVEAGKGSYRKSSAVASYS